MMHARDESKRFIPLRVNYCAVIRLETAKFYSQSNKNLTAVGNLGIEMRLLFLFCKFFRRVVYIFMKAFSMAEV